MGKILQREGILIMGKFRKRPVVVEAVKFVELLEGSDPEGFKVEGLPAPWLSEAYLKPPHEEGAVYTTDHGRHDKRLWVRTLEGQLRISPGDWIIRGTAGELYPCKPAIFESIYEPVEP
jgi:hypothetical protein